MSMTGINRRFFDGLMADKKLSLRALAARMGMSHSSLSLTLSGARRMTLDEAAQVSQIFNIPVHEVFEALGIPTRPVAGTRVSVVGSVNGDGSVLPVDGTERTTSPPGMPDDVVAIQFRTAGTPLDWADGWVAFCKKPNGPRPMVGTVCYCQIKGGSAALGLVKRGYRENTYNLCGPYMQESVSLEWASPILLIRC